MAVLLVLICATPVIACFVGSMANVVLVTVGALAPLALVVLAFRSAFGAPEVGSLTEAIAQRRCPFCWYDLSGLARTACDHPRCPGCGKSWPSQGPEPERLA